MGLSDGEVRLREARQGEQAQGRHGRGQAQQRGDVGPHREDSSAEARSGSQAKAR